MTPEQMSERAQKLFLDGFHCSQALFAVGDYQGAITTVYRGMSQLDTDQWGFVVQNYAQYYGDYSFSGDAAGERLIGAARIWEIGGGAGFRFSPLLDLRMQASWLTGDAEEGAVDLSGFDLLTAFRWTY